MKRFLTTLSGVMFVMFAASTLFFASSANASSIYADRMHAMTVDYPNKKTTINVLNPETGALTAKKIIPNFIGSVMQNTAINSETDGGHYIFGLVGRDTTSNKLSIRTYDADLYYAEHDYGALDPSLQHLEIKGRFNGSLLAENPYDNNQQYLLGVYFNSDFQSYYDGFEDNDGFSVSKIKLTGDRVPAGLSDYGGNRFFQNNSVSGASVIHSTNSDPEATANVTITPDYSVSDLQGKHCTAQYEHNNTLYCSVWASGWFDSKFGSDIYKIGAGSTPSQRVITYWNGSWAGTKYIQGFLTENYANRNVVLKDGTAQKYGIVVPENFYVQQSPDTFTAGFNPSTIRNMTPYLPQEQFIAAASYPQNSDTQNSLGPFAARVLVAKNRSNNQHYLYPYMYGSSADRYTLQAPFTTLDDVAYSKQQNALIVAGRFYGSTKTYVSKIVLNHQNKTASFQSLGEIDGVFNAGLAQRRDGTIEVLKSGKIYRLEAPLSGAPSLTQLHAINTTANDGKPVNSCGTFTVYNNWYYCTVNSNRTYGNAATDDYYRISPLNNYQPEHLGTAASLYDLW